MSNRRKHADSGMRLRQTGEKFEIRVVAEILRKQQVSNSENNIHQFFQSKGLQSILKILDSPLSPK